MPRITVEYHWPDLRYCPECRREFNARGWHHHQRLHDQADRLQPALYHLVGLSVLEIRQRWGVSWQVARIWQRRSQRYERYERYELRPAPGLIWS